MVFLRSVLDFTPQRTTKSKSILQEIVKYSTEDFGLLPKDSKTRAFTGAKGTTGLAANETNMVNSICQFRGCDELAINRKEGEGFRFVGGAAFFHSQPKSNLPQIKDFVDQDGEALLEECILIVYIDLAIASL
jgi:hypothetical protein